MAIVRWNPIRQLAAMEVERLNRMFDDVWGREIDAGRFVPPVDIYENDTHEVVLKAEVPGLKKGDIDLRVENNTLTITGERSEEQNVTKEQYHRVERSYGSFCRSFSLPATIDSARVGAEYKDGVLTVTLPMREESRPKQIEIDIKS